MKVLLFFLLPLFFLWPLFSDGLFGLSDLVIEASAEPNPTFVSTDEALLKLKNETEVKLIKFSSPRSYGQILSYCRQYGEVEYIEPNYHYHAANTPNDPKYGEQWYLERIKAPQAWDKVNSSPDFTVAIVDSGVYTDHPDLKDNIWRNKKEIAGNGIDDDHNGFIDDVNGWDFVSNTADPAPKFEKGYTESGVLHGTVVAGVIGATGNNGEGVAGVSWKVKIMPLRVLDSKGEGKTSEVVRAIDYAIKNGADVINFSFVGFNYSKSLYEAVERAYKAGVIMVAAAGNEQNEGEGYNLNETPMYPACLDGNKDKNMMIGVAATDALDQKANFSSYGDCVDLAAPGISVYSTTVYAPRERIGGEPLVNFYDGYWSGTSMAAPIVSSAVALVEAANPELSRKAVIKAIIDTADDITKLNPLYKGQLGRGRINLSRAVRRASIDLEVKNPHLVVAPVKGLEPKVKVVNLDGSVESEFFAYHPWFKGGVSLAAGDIDGNGADEIVTAPGPGGGPQIKIFDKKGKALGQFFAYNPGYRGGISVAVGDVDGDGHQDIVTAIGVEGKFEVKMFNNKGRVLGHFIAFAKANFKEMSVAVGDVDGNGVGEIVVGAGAGAGPQVKVFSKDGKLLNQFFGYNQSFRGGVRVALGKVEGGVRANKDIVVAPGAGGGPHIRVFNYKGSLKSEFFAYGDKYLGGVQVTTGDLNKDGLAEISTGAGPSGVPYVRSFKLDGSFFASFYAFDSKKEVGVNLAVLEK